MEMGDKTAKVLETRERILDLLKMRGPSLPVHIAKATGISMIFAGAFLSELIAEKFVKTSSMKVGGSPLYLLPGQEPMLENFSQFFGGKEKEAFLLLKEQKVLQDDKLEPAIRVALRSLKDFGEQITVRQKLEGLDREFIFWRYFLFSEDDAKKNIENILEPKKPIVRELKKEKIEDIKGAKEYEQEQDLVRIKSKREIKKIPKNISASQSIQGEFLPIQKEILNETPLFQKSEFILSLQKCFDKFKIKVIEEKSSSKREFEGIVEMETPLGGMQFLAVAKDKKTVLEKDVVIALQKAQVLRLPALFMAPGKLEKKSQEYIDKWHSFIKFRKIE